MFRIGHGYDVHALKEELPLRLGGVDIPHTKGCIAHSDGDVVVHALCDALLGAIGEGDIGRHFPDTDPQYQGIDSLRLLMKVAAIVRKRGFAIMNVDITIEAQAPKLASYIDTMIENLACTMQIDILQVSVKATTTERLGFVGREEGIAATAVALIQVVAYCKRPN